MCIYIQALVLYLLYKLLFYPINKDIMTTINLQCIACNVHILMFGS